MTEATSNNKNTIEFIGSAAYKNGGIVREKDNNGGEITTIILKTPDGTKIRTVDGAVCTMSKPAKIVFTEKGNLEEGISIYPLNPQSKDIPASSPPMNIFSSVVLSEGKIANRYPDAMVLKGADGSLSITRDGTTIRDNLKPILDELQKSAGLLCDRPVILHPIDGICLAANNMGKVISADFEVTDCNPIKAPQIPQSATKGKPR